MENQNNLSVWLIIGIIILGVTIYFLYKNSNKSILDTLTHKNVEEFNLDYIKSYYTNHLPPKNCKKAVLKVTQDDKFYPQEGAQGKEVYLLTFYNEETQSIEESISEVILADRTHINLREAFNGKKLLIIE
ncbi:hypothetical protein EDL98_05820 [Ornithobacterium rhinotracheale]|uniref:hypothetical protein n=1 Tax=Ornithobacterium rhinotracheale TaxID=28251 RepID=UPI00129C53EB|nr:hypothetical protein [Ornithobacterium rhinotracheale]MRJ08101.1 hypothetical protein [Ornithobacterium rhinotracheale]MRJ10600.1 hypothetical protein [Ornithobacterium rhinotracheale]UOH78392.1 hypothetical protein MT996_02730 [Ornithobacterium rhinotracheale]